MANTLSMTRLLMTPNIFRYLGTAKESTEYATKDTDFLSSIHRTISGLEPGRYFFSGSTLGKVVAHPLLKCIMNKFDGLVSMMEMEYYMRLWENLEEFADFGWIMTDYCPDGIDGKQITLNTYVPMCRWLCTPTSTLAVRGFSHPARTLVVVAVALFFCKFLSSSPYFASK
jgi:hypothetical protein